MGMSGRIWVVLMIVHKEGNEEGVKYNGRTFNVGTAGNDVYSNGATGNGYKSVYDGGRVETSSSGIVPLITASASTSPSSLITTPVSIVLVLSFLFQWTV